MMFELPLIKPNANEYIKLVGTFEGVTWNTNPRPLVSFWVWFFTFKLFKFSVVPSKRTNQEIVCNFIRKYKIRNLFKKIY